MAVESPYFSHDYNARNDRKMVTLRKREGMTGLGVYWSIVEMLYEEGGYLALLEIENISFELRVKPEVVRRIVCDYELFRVDGEKFWSESALSRIEIRNSKTTKARESALEGWNRRKGDANAMRSHSDGNAIKERKGKDNKEKDSKGQDTVAVSVWPEFEDFWDLYGKKQDRHKCEKLWKKIEHPAREEIMIHLEGYVRSTPELKYRKNPLTYLNGKCWNDEIITHNNGKPKLAGHAARATSLAESIGKRYGAVDQAAAADTNPSLGSGSG